ncbi:hypothetical protein [Pseudoduganella namucuonensis]|uniref:hypothetical protein n=1 Tax=Pseudoduganella namucuonensis TaxID=1035707 RepID=UPI0011606CD6|nr:hypothetical protein [Pseudoduganella namucuonensis]
MSTTCKPTPPTEFTNVLVTAIPEKDSVTGKTKYKTTFSPESITITTNDAVINYQLVEPTPKDVKFKKMTVKPEDNDQLSVPSISKSGKIITFSDANTTKETLAISLKFSDSAGTEFVVDPDVNNDPEPQ